MTAMFPVLWHNAPDVIVDFHPFYDYPYDLKWFEIFLFMYLKPVVYIVAIANYQDEKILVLMFGIFELAQEIDFFLTFSHTPFRQPVGISLGIFTFIHYLEKEWQSSRKT